MALPLQRLQATELVLRSYALADESATHESVMRARKLLDNALHLEPNLVLALVSRTYNLNGELDVDPHPDRDRIAREMDEFSSRATKIDPTDPQAWSARSLALAIGHRWNAALEAIDQAIRFDPYGSGHYADKAWLMNMNGQPAKALPLIDQAIALKPRSISANSPCPAAKNSSSARVSARCIATGELCLLASITARVSKSGETEYGACGLNAEVIDELLLGLASHSSASVTCRSTVSASARSKAQTNSVGRHR